MLRATGTEIVLANTYHLMLRPGAERVARLGGLHRFMAWPGPILTDSGGYQVMSLAERRTLDEDGVTFASHLDGSRHRLTPERAVEIQDLLDATVTMVLDECTPWPIAPRAAAASMRRSMRWAERCRAAFRARPGYGLFGIVQGSVFPELRLRIGGAPGRDRLRRLRDRRSRGRRGPVADARDGRAHRGGAAGGPPALPHGRRQARGSDRRGRRAESICSTACCRPAPGAPPRRGPPRAHLNLRNRRHADDPGPLEPGCACPACRDFSRAYLHHLIKAGEILGAMLLTWHNLHHYQALMATLRAAIARGDLADAWPRASPPRLPARPGAMNLPLA